jgi:hypothetical protein
MLGTLLNAKRLQLLFLRRSLVAMFVNPTRSLTQTDVQEMRSSADKIGQKIVFLNVRPDSVYRGGSAHQHA